MFFPVMNGFVEINENLEVLGRPRHLLIYISPQELGIQWTGWVVQKHTIHPPSSKPSLWSRPGLQLSFLCNYLDPVSQTQCGYQSTNSELRDRKELHCRTALPSTTCEQEASLANEPVAPMIRKVSFNWHSVPFLQNTLGLGGIRSLTITS